MVDQLQSAAQANYIWNGVYPTWDEACAVAKAIGGNGFGSERWLLRIIQQISDYRNERRQYGIAMPPRPCGLPLVCAMTVPGTIVDFGGSSGWCWDYLRNTWPGHQVRSYVVVETESVVNHITAAGIHETPVKYLTLQDTLDPCDLLYCNSVLQYFGSNAPLLSLIARTLPGFVFLEDVVATGEDDFFSTQSYWGTAIPYRFLGLVKLLRELRGAGYTEVVRYPYASPILGVTKPFDMGNFPEAKRLRYSSSILLRKCDRP